LHLLLLLLWVRRLLKMRRRLRLRRGFDRSAVAAIRRVQNGSKIHGDEFEPTKDEDFATRRRRSSPARGKITNQFRRQSLV
jgi:hypothetical protein